MKCVGTSRAGYYPSYLQRSKTILKQRQQILHTQTFNSLLLTRVRSQRLGDAPRVSSLGCCPAPRTAPSGRCLPSAAWEHSHQGTCKGTERGLAFLGAGLPPLTRRAWTWERPLHEPPTPTASPRAAVKVRNAGKSAHLFSFRNRTNPGLADPKGLFPQLKSINEILQFEQEGLKK